MLFLSSCLSVVVELKVPYIKLLKNDDNSSLTINRFKGFQPMSLRDHIEVATLHFGQAHEKNY